MDAPPRRWPFARQDEAIDAAEAVELEDALAASAGGGERGGARRRAVGRLDGRTCGGWRLERRSAIGGRRDQRVNERGR